MRVAEQRAATDEAGAGIQLGPNALRALETLGVLERLRDHAHAPPAILIRSFSRGRQIASVPLGAEVVRRYGAPYWTLARKDLQRALADAVSAATVPIERGFRIQSARQSYDGVTLVSADGRELRGRALIGADGVWSAVRSTVLGEAPPRFTGHVAWRTVIERCAAPEPFAGESVCLWLGPSAHLVHYSVEGGDKVNVVAVIVGAEAREGWDEPGDPRRLEGAFAGWTASVRRLIGSTQGWRCWSLHARAASLPAAQGRIVLVGDAAHPVLPFLAQGAALALEDAVALAGALGRSPASPALAFERFAADRRSRWLRVQQESRRNGQLYHLRGPLAAARDLALRLSPPGRLIGRYDWLYGYGRSAAGG